MSRQGIALSQTIAGLDGIRGIASILILLFHGFYGAMIPFFEAPPVWTGFGKFLVVATEPLSGGVDIFFVLSGFLITRTLYAAEPLTSSDVLSFYWRRLARLYPLYLVLLLVLGAMEISLGFLLLASVFLANVADLFQFPSFWLPIWSIAVEIHFYFLWPLFLRVSGRRGLAIISAILVLASPLLRAWGYHHGGNIYAHTWFRLDGLAAGSLLAWFVLEAKASASVLRSICFLGIVIFGAIVFLRPEFLNRTVLEGQIYGCELWQLLAVSLICGVLVKERLFAWLESKFLVTMGLWSYGVFLIHPVLFALWRRIEFGLNFSAGEMTLVFGRALIVFAVSIALGAFSFYFFEKPAYKFLIEFSSRKK